MFKSLIRVILGFGILCLPLILFASSPPQFSGGIGGINSRTHEDYAAMFKAGDTNAPLLVMDWSVNYCRVSQSGTGVAGANDGHHNRNGYPVSLNGTNWLALRDTINTLPPSSKRSLPVERQILISGIRNNQWFDCVYDRADIPPEVEKLYEITHASLSWYIPVVEGRHIAHSEYGDYHKYQCTIYTLVAANDLPIAVSSGANGIQIWNFKQGSVQDIGSLNILEDYSSSGTPAVIWSEGNAVAYAGDAGVYGVDLKTRKMLWKTGPLDHDDFHGKILAVGGGGRYLFTAGSHIIERRDLISGKSRSILTNTSARVSALLSSRNGSILLAGFGADFGSGILDSSGRSFAIWESGSDKPLYEFLEPVIARASISPDGQTIVLSEPGGTFILCDWRKGKKQEIPIRVSYPAFPFPAASSICWSPDGTRLAVHFSLGFEGGIFVYDTVSWKPLAQWSCGPMPKFAVSNEGLLLKLEDHDLDGLDLKTLKVGGD